MPLWNQRVSYHKDWIIQTGCQFSSDPPAEWNCDQGGVAPETSPAPVMSPPTKRPTPRPTPIATPHPTRVPTRRTFRPTRVPTRRPITESTSEPTPSPTVPPVNGDGEDGANGSGSGSGSSFICPVCGEGNNISSPNATVLVPILGEFLCGDLVEAAENGDFTEGECGIIQVVSVPCLCEPANATAVEDGPANDTPSFSPARNPSQPTVEPIDSLPPNVPTLPPFQFTNSTSSECASRSDNDAMLVPITVRIQFDASPEDIGWYIADDAYKCFRVGVPALAYDKNLSSVEEVVYVIGGLRYMFVIEDSQGNGLCCGRVPENNGGTNTNQASRPGSYSVMSGDTMLVSGGGDFGSQELSNFTAPETL